MWIQHFSCHTKHTSFTYYTFNNNLNKITNGSGCLASVIFSVLWPSATRFYIKTVGLLTPAEVLSIRCFTIKMIYLEKITIYLIASLRVRDV